MTRQTRLTAKTASWIANVSARLALGILLVLTLTGRAKADPTTDAGRATIIQNFFTAYQAAITNPSAVPALLSLLVPDGTDAAPCVLPYGVLSCGAEINVEWTYAGAPGRALPFAGTWAAQQGVMDALAGIRNTSTTNSFLVKEILTGAYEVNFEKGFSPNEFLIPQPYQPPVGYGYSVAYRSAALLKEFRTVNSTGIQYRGDIACLLTIEESGLISNVHFYYDSYVPSQAYVGTHNQIVNPDIDPVLTPLRNASTNTAPPVPGVPEPLSAVLNFFITFSNPYVNVEGNFASALPSIITPNCIVSFAGDPKYLPFADNVIRQGADEVILTFEQQLANSRPRAFDLEEFFFPAATPVAGCEPCTKASDRVVTNANETRFSSHTNMGYNPEVMILMTVRDDLVASVQGVFDSVLTTTAFTGRDPFNCEYPAFNWLAGGRHCFELNPLGF